MSQAELSGTSWFGASGRKLSAFIPHGNGSALHGLAPQGPGSQEGQRQGRGCDFPVLSILGESQQCPAASTALPFLSHSLRGIIAKGTLWWHRQNLSRLCFKMRLKTNKQTNNRAGESVLSPAVSGRGGPRVRAANPGADAAAPGAPQLLPGGGSRVRGSRVRGC